MGILNEMFGDENNEENPSYEGEFIAECDYTSDPDEIMSGYKVYQKKYVYKSLALKLFIVLIAMMSSVMMMFTSGESDIMPAFCLLLCIVIGWWFISQPIGNKKKLVQGLELMKGTPYKAEFFTDKIIISDMSPTEENTEEKTAEDAETEEFPDENDEKPPATVIHLDSSIVDLLEKTDMFILVVNKAYVFIIPKSGFTEENIDSIREKLSAVMGIRYKAV